MSPYASRHQAVRAAAALVTLLTSLIALALLFRRPTGPPPLPAWFARLPAGDESRFFSPAPRMRKLRQEDETRNAILASKDTPLRQELTPQADTVVQVAFSTVCPPPYRCGGGVLFNADVVAGTTRVRLLQTRIVVDRSPARWETKTIDLRRFRNQHVTLELSVHPYGQRDEAGGQIPPPAGVWGEPLLLGGAPERRPNVLLISLDTLRADHLGSYGYTRPTSPALDRFAAEGVRFTQAMSQSPWTTPSHMSLFTSLYPSTHRVNQSWEFLTRALDGRVSRRALAPTVITLPEALRAHGYRTLGLTGGATMTGAFGFAQGFDVYRESSAKLTRNVSAILGDWLSVYGKDPFFLFFHTFEVHAPYTHLTFAGPLLSDAQRAEIAQLVDARDPQDWVNLDRDLVAYLRAQGLFRREITEPLYDGGIRAADDFLNALFMMLRQRDLYDNTLIIVFSDHGEEFGEHDADRIYGAHGTSMYDVMIQVPLLMRMPGRLPSGTVVAPLVELIDVAPTVLDLLGIAAPKAMRGTSLTALIDGAAGERKDWAMSEATSKGAELKALRTQDFKYIMVGSTRDDERTGVPRQIEHELLFDLRNDPSEQHPLYESTRMTAMRTQLEALLRSTPAQPTRSDEAVIDADVHERLRALGYTK